MRIIAGTARGHKLFSPGKHLKKALIRPTSDRAREAVFNIIGTSVQEARVLDLFAGTGALGLEALSRGAVSSVFVDKSRSATDLIRRNIELCDRCGQVSAAFESKPDFYGNDFKRYSFSKRSVVVRHDLTKGLYFLKRFVPTDGFSLVLLDPPYGRKLSHKILPELINIRLISVGGLIIAEDKADEDLPEMVGEGRLYDQRHYGETGFWFYRM